jgi:hypothetical protein
MARCVRRKPRDSDTGWLPLLLFLTHPGFRVKAPASAGGLSRQSGRSCRRFSRLHSLQSARLSVRVPTRSTSGLSSPHSSHASHPTLRSRASSASVMVGALAYHHPQASRFRWSLTSPALKSASRSIRRVGRRARGGCLQGEILPLTDRLGAHRITHLLDGPVSVTQSAAGTSRSHAQPHRNRATGRRVLERGGRFRGRTPSQDTTHHDVGGALTR